MNLVQVHLALNHLPVIGMIFGLGTLLTAKVKKSVDLQQFAWGVFVLTALSTGGLIRHPELDGIASDSSK